MLTSHVNFFKVKKHFFTSRNTTTHKNATIDYLKIQEVQLYFLTQQEHNFKKTLKSNQMTDVSKKHSGKINKVGGIPPANRREHRCPCCNRLLFKSVVTCSDNVKQKKCIQCKLPHSCQNCEMLCQTPGMKNNYSSRSKCEFCRRDIECSACERYYYKYWVAERNKPIMVKCPKCKKIITTRQTK